jgi:SAM-dependent methyltransferase
MRDNVREFVRCASEAFALQGPVYEFGSYLPEGQEELADLRPLFPGQQYIGCDLRPGRGVNRVEDLASLTLADASAQTIVCVETLEHVFEARRAVEEMIRVLRPGGVLLVAAPLDFRIHDYPSDYWRLTPSCMTRLLAPLDATLVGWQGSSRFPHTVFGVATKGPVSPRFVRGAGEFVRGMQAMAAAAAGRQPWQRRLKQWAASWFTNKSEHVRRRDYFQMEFVFDLPKGPDWRHELLEMAPSEPQLGSRIDLV